MPEIPKAVEPDWNVKVDRTIREIRVSLQERPDKKMLPAITISGDEPGEVFKAAEISKADWAAMKLLFAKYLK